MTDPRSESERPAGRAGTLEPLLTATLASFGLMWATALLAVAAAGALQWVTLPTRLDNAVPLVLLAGGLVFAGRVTAGVAPRQGTYASLAAGALVIVFGLSLSWATEAHGDGIEAQHAIFAGLTAAAISGASAFWMDRRVRNRQLRRRHPRSPKQPADAGPHKHSYPDVYQSGETE